MKKGQEGPGLLVTLISAVIVIAVIAGFYLTYKNFIGSRSNIDARRTWVELRSSTAGIDIVTSEESPVIDLEEPLEIKSEEDLVWQGNNPPRVFKKIADSMVDCWIANARGESDYINAVGKEIDCFTCRPIIFSEELKINKPRIIGFNKYLNEQRVRGQNSQTYLQILSNDLTYSADEAELQDDEIIVDSNMHIIFFAASGRGWVNIFSNVLGVGDIVEEQAPSVDSGVIVQEEGSGDIRATRALGVAGAAATGQATLPTLSRKLAEASAQVAAGSSDKVLIELAQSGVDESAVRYVAMSTSAGAASKKAVASSVGRVIGKILSTKGVRFLAAKAALPITIIAGAQGVWQIFWGKKPFSAKVMIVDPEKVYEICNA